MKRRPLVLAYLLLGLAAAGCQEQPTEPAPPTATTFQRTAAALLGAPSLDRSQPPALEGARLADPQLGDIARRAINPADYICVPNTPVIDWYTDAVVDFIVAEPDLFDLLYNNLLADLVPFYDAILFQTVATPQHFGYNGEYTKIVQKTERDVKRFWDIPSADIQVIGMHGTMLTDVARVAATYQTVFGVPPALAPVFASIVRDAVLQSQVLNGGNHPLFSFNAVAVSFPSGGNPDKIVMGDGMLAGYEAVGLGDVAPQAVFAHEFAHHIQFANGYNNDPFATQGTAAERTRYTELMADAMGAYYLTHKRGATMNRKRVEQFLAAYFQIGDCAFTSGGHHGTQNQRMAAARFGFDVADQAQKQGHIMTSEQFHALFVAAYPQLIAPDAT